MRDQNTSAPKVHEEVRRSTKGPQFGKVYKAILEDPHMTRNAVLVYTGLTLFADRSNSDDCFPGIRTLKTLLHIGTDAIRDGIDKLIELGYLEREYLRGVKTVYTLHDVKPAWEKAIEKDKANTDESDQLELEAFNSVPAVGTPTVPAVSTPVNPPQVHSVPAVGTEQTNNKPINQTTNRQGEILEKFHLDKNDSSLEAASLVEKHVAAADLDLFVSFVTQKRDRQSERIASVGGWTIGLLKKTSVYNEFREYRKHLERDQKSTHDIYFDCPYCGTKREKAFQWMPCPKCGRDETGESYPTREEAAQMIKTAKAAIGAA